MWSAWFSHNRNAPVRPVQMSCAADVTAVRSAVSTFMVQTQTFSWQRAHRFLPLSPSLVPRCQPERALKPQSSLGILKHVCWCVCVYQVAEEERMASSESPKLKLTSAQPSKVFRVCIIEWKALNESKLLTGGGMRKTDESPPFFFIKLSTI